jgi:hypothetical protein
VLPSALPIQLNVKVVALLLSVMRGSVIWTEGVEASRSGLPRFLFLGATITLLLLSLRLLAAAAVAAILVGASRLRFLLFSIRSPLLLCDSLLSITKPAGKGGRGQRD